MGSGGGFGGQALLWCFGSSLVDVPQTPGSCQCRCQGSAAGQVDPSSFPGTHSLTNPPFPHLPCAQEGDVHSESVTPWLLVAFPWRFSCPRGGSRGEDLLPPLALSSPYFIVAGKKQIKIGNSQRHAVQFFPPPLCPFSAFSTF